MKLFYKGDDIKEAFRLWYDSDKTQPVNFDTDIEEIIVRLYTNSIDIKKFSMTDKTSDGYVQLVRSSATLLYILLEGHVTKIMQAGNINIAVTIIMADADLSDDRKSMSCTGVLGILKENPNANEL